MCEKKILVCSLGVSTIALREKMSRLESADDRQAFLLNEIEKYGVKPRAFRLRGAYPSFFELLQAIQREHDGKKPKRESLPAMSRRARRDASSSGTESEPPSSVSRYT